MKTNKDSFIPYREMHHSFSYLNGGHPYLTRTEATNLPHKTSTPADARNTLNILLCKRVHNRGYHTEFIKLIYI